MTAEDRRQFRQILEPRGPYVPTSDASISRSTLISRTKDAWKTLETTFGAAQGRVEGSLDNPKSYLDPHMLAGLTAMFQFHRDYLITLTHDLGIAEIITRGVLPPQKTTRAKVKKGPLSGEGGRESDDVYNEAETDLDD